MCFMRKLSLPINMRLYTVKITYSYEIYETIKITASITVRKQCFKKYYLLYYTCYHNVYVAHNNL